jgi:hypothetical protein
MVSFLSEESSVIIIEQNCTIATRASVQAVYLRHPLTGPTDEKILPQGSGSRILRHAESATVLSTGRPV